MPQGHTQCQRVTRNATGSHTMPQGHTQCHRVTHNATGSHTMPQGHTQCHRVTHNATGSHAMPQGHTQCLRVTRNATGSHAMPQGHTQCLRVTHSTTHHVLGSLYDYLMAKHKNMFISPISTDLVKLSLNINALSNKLTWSCEVVYLFPMKWQFSHEMAQQALPGVNIVSEHHRHLLK